MSEEYIPDECPICDRVGTVVFEKAIHRAVSRGRFKGVATYEHHGCYCTACGEHFVTAVMMNRNLHRIREAFEKMEVTRER